MKTAIKKVGWVAKYHDVALDTDAYIAYPETWRMSPDVQDAFIFTCHDCARQKMERSPVPYGFKAAGLIKVKRIVSTELMEEV
jgi:hypothetical protein